MPAADPEPAIAVPASSPALPRPLPAAAWLLLGALGEAGYALWLRQAGAVYAARLAVYLLLFAPALLAAALRRGRRAAGADLAWALGIAAVFRLTLLPAPPLLSDDIYRYIWDGTVQRHGINPFQYAPADPSLAPLRGALFPRLNHPDLHTTYPPLCQLLFLVVALFSRSVVAMKALMVAAEIGTWVVLVRIWRLKGLSLARLLLYLWNPLVVLEVAGSGHNDAIGVGLLLCSSLLIILARPGVSIAALAASVAAKYVPIIALPTWMRSVPRRFWALAPLVWILAWAPYLGAGRNLWEGLGAYARSWEGNAFLFRYLRDGVAWLDLKPFLDRLWGDACRRAGAAEWAGWIWPYTEPRQIAKALVAAGLGVAVLSWVRRRAEPPWVAFRLLGLALLWAPVLHPWYLLWVVPFAAWYGSAAWLLFSATVFLAYAPDGWAGLTGEARLWLEYAPVLAVLAAEEWARRRREAGPAAISRTGS